MKKETKFLSIVALLLMVLCFTKANQAEAKKVDDKIKDSIEDVSSFLKNEVDKLGNNLSKVQDFLENYHWKGVIQDTATSGAETLSNLKLNGRSKVIVAAPNAPITGEVDCFLDPKEASLFTVYRVVLGIQGEGPQTTIGTATGFSSGVKHEVFALRAPRNPGFYQIRFRTAENYFEDSAMDAWFDEKGNEPDGTATIGIIYVKP